VGWSFRSNLLKLATHGSVLKVERNSTFARSVCARFAAQSIGNSRLRRFPVQSGFTEKVWATGLRFVAIVLSAN
jgi:hypothetical protein